LKNYQGPAAALINTLFGGQAFSSAAISLPPILLGYNNDLVWFNKNLDHSQKEAVEFALKQREIAVVHGPPGTGKFMFLGYLIIRDRFILHLKSQYVFAGKTTTVVEIILQTVKAGSRVLACAPSNVAVDNMLEKLVSNSSVKAIRLGHPTRMQEVIQNRSLDAVLSNSEARSIVNDVRRDLDAQLKEMTTTKK
jgi:ATP-dependent RNA/DNA helicase IGHMBP2